MQTRLPVRTFTLALAILLAPCTQANASSVSEPVQHSQQVAPAQAGVKRGSHKKLQRHYSKATLSAFKPIAQVPPAKPVSAASSPLIPASNAPSLRPTLVSAQPQFGTAALQADDQPTPVEVSTELGDDEGSLGSESVSVIDRFRDKPKAQPLVRGPLRVRMHDQGVRASVQIPLALN